MTTAATTTEIYPLDQDRTVGTRQAPDVRGSGWRLLRHELRQRRRSLAPVLGWSAVEALPTLLSGWLVAMAADQGFLAGRPWVGAAWLGVFGCCQLVRAFAARALLPRLADVVEPLRDVMVRKVVAGALQRAVQSGDRPDTSALARLTEEVQTIRGLISTLMLEARHITISLVSACIGLAALSLLLAGLAIAPVLLCLLVYLWLQRQLKARQHAVIVGDEAIARDTMGMLEGLRDVVACGAQGRTAATLGTAIDGQARAERRLATAEATRMLVIALGEALPLLGMLLATPWLIGSQHMATGQVLGAITYIVSGLQPAVSSLLDALGGFGLQLGVTLDRIAHTSPAPPLPAMTGVTPNRCTLHTQRLTYAYNPNAVPVIRDLTLTVAEGEHLAIVGPSGIGKSTLVDLLSGITAAQQGAVQLGGVPLESVDKGQLRRLIALIPQESYVFVGTLRDNLRYLAPDATDTDLDRAVDAVGLRDLAERLGGYDAQLSVLGPVLSAGERQLVALARVYLSPAHVVILDEGTCYLDPAAESTAERAFRERPGTLIVVAHRMSSARRADRILVMDGGSPMTGTHEHLLTNSPLYRELIGHWTADPGYEGFQEKSPAFCKEIRA